MFLNCLSDSLLSIFGEQKMSYEMAAELCDLNERTIRNIICHKSVPTIVSLEKLCNGFQKTPSELLLNITEHEALTYRMAMKVSDAKLFRSSFSFSVFPLCPRCARTLSREYQAYCDRCGQFLDWEAYQQTESE